MGSRKLLIGVHNVTDGTESQPTRTTNTADSTDTSEATETGTADITETGTETGTQTRSTGTRTTKSRVTSVDPRSPPGGIKMITPAPTDGTTYIKVGDLATFSWNYTSVKVTPTAVDVVAFCNKNQYYYTMAGNQTYKETGGVTWDTSTHETDQPLLTEIYTLLVYDVDIGPSDLPPPGRLGAQRNFKFGVYHPQEYTPLSSTYLFFVPWVFFGGWKS